MTRKITLGIRLTESEKEELKKMSNELGMSISEFIRYLVLYRKNNK